CARNYSPDYW
nr:immunoglobulin heavy chain junction region [Mus musculus]